jgi:hypothetical protein
MLPPLPELPRAKADREGDDCACYQARVETGCHVGLQIVLFSLEVCDLLL